MVTELRVFFNYRKRPLVGRASLVTQRDLEPDGTGTVSGSCSWQLALFTTEWQGELWPAVALSQTSCILYVVQDHRFEVVTAVLMEILFFLNGTLRRLVNKSNY
jgi:hypothetical protein